MKNKNQSDQKIYSHKDCLQYLYIGVLGTLFFLSFSALAFIKTVEWLG